MLARVEALEHQRGEMSLEIVRSNETGIELQKLYTKTVDSANTLLAENTKFRLQLEGTSRSLASPPHLYLISFSLYLYIFLTHSLFIPLISFTSSPPNPRTPSPSLPIV
jgi:hypothetical protein